MKRVPVAVAVLLAAGLSAGASAQVNVNALVTPLGGSFHYDLAVENLGATDVILVSIVDAPLSDPLITPSLLAPSGYQASYDPGLGVVDLLEDTNLFAAATTTTGFSFESLSGPGPGLFTAFEAFDVNLDLIAGSVSTLVIPEPSSFALLAGLGIVLAGRAGRRAGSVSI